MRTKPKVGVKIHLIWRFRELCEAMYRIFGDIPHCLNQRDDILICGTKIDEHNKTLEIVLQ